MTPEEILSANKLRNLPGYKKLIVQCEKCNSKIVYETDYLTVAQAKTMHKCKGGNNAKSK